MSTQTVHVHIEGMNCAHCAQTVERALLAIDGVQAATVDLEEQEAVVQCDPNVVESATLVTAIEEAGYQASIMAGARA
jgi:copper chaperone CopZ